MKALAVLLVLAGLVLMGWLSFYVMLYGGIMQAIDNWGIDDGAVVWGIIMAVFFEMGCIPGTVLIMAGVLMWGWGEVRGSI